jgi:hypothetical protein
VEYIHSEGIREYIIRDENCTVCVCVLDLGKEHILGVTNLDQLLYREDSITELPCGPRCQFSHPRERKHCRKCMHGVTFPVLLPECDLLPSTKCTSATTVTNVVAWRFPFQSLRHAQTHTGPHVRYSIQQFNLNKNWNVSIDCSFTSPHQISLQFRFNRRAAWF